MLELIHIGAITSLIIKTFLAYAIYSGIPDFPFHIAEKPTDIPIRAIYISAYTAGDPSKFLQLVDLVERTELNAVVIDVKDHTGRVFVATEHSLIRKIGSYQKVITNLSGLISGLKEKGIYTIARIVVFQDPYFAEKRLDLAVKNKSGVVWRDFNGLAWVDASKQEVWDYNVAVAKSAVLAGFDEVNFDYVRFPSDGRIREMNFAFETTGRTKKAVMYDFFRYINRQIRYLPVRTSVDVFGMTLWQDDGLGIGQRFKDTIGNFDYVYPMVYPSHYPKNFNGYENPADYPYEIVYSSLDKGKKYLSDRMTKIRPWIQDFDIGSDYDQEKIVAQIKAAYDAGSDGWLIWNAANRYTVEALKTE